LADPQPHALRIADDFSETPFGRYKDDGPESGELFRDNYLIPALKTHSRVRLILDGVEGLPSSFWEEVMGGLIRHGWSVADVRDKLELVTEEPDLKTYVRLGWRYAEEAASKLKH
jgi:hypothetical protein